MTKQSFLGPCRRKWRICRRCEIEHNLGGILLHASTSETIAMTFKSIMNFGGFGGTQSTAMDRYHSGPSGYDHGYRHGGYKGGGGKGGGGGGGSGAALSALTLLAFLFLLNVMQQSLRDTNSTTTAATILLKEDLPRAVSLSEMGEDKANKRKDVGAHLDEEYLIPVKTTSRDKRSEI